MLGVCGKPVKMDKHPIQGDVSNPHNCFMPLKLGKLQWYGLPRPEG